MTRRVLGRPISEQIRILEAELARLRGLAEADVEFEIPERDDDLSLADKIVLLNKAQANVRLKPEKVRNLIEWAIEVGSAASQAGCPIEKNIARWIQETRMRP